MNITDLIKATISTLNTVEVKGKDNMSALLGCINALETVVQILEKPAAEAPAHTEEQTKEAING